MAPKAAKAAPKAGAAKPKEKKEKNEEAEAAKVSQPDRAVMDEKLQQIQVAIDKLQGQQRELSTQINEKSYGKDDFNVQRAELFAERDECSKEMDRLQALKDEINESLGVTKQQGMQMRSELNKMKKQLGYTSEGDIDKRIADIERKMHSESLSLKDEKAFMVELKSLKQSRPKVSQVHQMEENISNRDTGVPLKERLQTINAEMNEWREKKKAVQAKVTVLMEGRKEKLGDVPQLIEKRDELAAQIKEKIGERNQIRDEFREEERKFRDHLAEQRRARAEKAGEERDARQKEFEQRRLLREAEKLDEQPFTAEITLLEQAILFCKGLTSAKEKKEEAPKQTVFDLPEGMELVVPKKDRDEIPAGKKKGKAKKAEDVTAKPIKHNADTFQVFDKLKLNAPITTADVPALLVQLEDKLAHYNEKVKEWDLKREEMKRIILEGGTLPDAEKEAADTAEQDTGDVVAEDEPEEDAKNEAVEEPADDGDNAAEDED